ncbi:four helix bundle protein [Aquimarina addita]|uniref:Four helix bundle protein n=1 Tax=Aquimarina addita TaxID=870485 RepID=A0ABP6UP51_9FLAO
MKRYNFKKLQIWTESMNFINETYKLTSTFPDYEKFGLRSQLNRCSVSIASNISEGTSKRTNKHFIKFLEDSLGSAFEREIQLIVSLRQEYISEGLFDSLENQVNILQKKISNFIDRLDP